MTEELDRLAAAHGIVRSYRALDGTISQASDDAVTAILMTLGVEEGADQPAAAPPGPFPPPPLVPEGAACFLPEFLQHGRAWGVTCQLYGLRSHRNWGIGDFEDLARIGETAARLGADFLGVNPLHALFLAEPQKASPFSPSDRNFLNPLYIAVDQLEGFDATLDLDDSALSRLREGDLVDYEAVTGHKLRVLRRIHERMRDANREAVRAFQEKGGAPLRHYALFEAISLEMVRRGIGTGWHAWPEEFQDPASGAVAAFAREHGEEIEFQVWLQWLADRQLGEASKRLHAAGMRIGLYLDLAVGTAPDGAATWSDRTLTVVGAEIGAPPDMFNPDGQCWGLAPWSPSEIAARDFRPVRRSYEAILRYAGALRIDHAMGLYRLFWIPSGFPAGQGAYVLYPMPEVVSVLAEVSQASRALIIGEDLGVVPEGFREQMDRANLLGYRIFYFERNDHGFVPPEHWPPSALACVGSHDTNTLAGWWTGSDIDVRQQIGLYDEDGARKERERRRREKGQAVEMLRARGDHEIGEDFNEIVAAGIHRLVASTPCRLLAAQMEDLLGLPEQPNIPGTIDEHPNWRRRLPVPIEELENSSMLRAVVGAIREERPRWDKPEVR
ncbi:4-alpha-glucanotransferase [Chelativorans sp. AA-79]|uniref:4-alpha-glucanotransferase n=1 Tax=Chelativorans sp. AA-79 TaxID=3028735 RepID=UPI0023F62388|nr:4-alpha-glucanotransferase [Chelativorans sp. AA-79]WEX10433.1 4-alpha-glucanotransferase [Chelativorans sp. AA-79]